MAKAGFFSRLKWKGGRSAAKPAARQPRKIIAEDDDDMGPVQMPASFLQQGVLAPSPTKSARTDPQHSGPGISGLMSVAGTGAAFMMY